MACTGKITDRLKYRFAEQCERVKRIKIKIGLYSDNQDYKGLARLYDDLADLKRVNDELIESAKRVGDKYLQKQLRLIEHRLIRIECQDIPEKAGYFDNA